MKRYKERGEGSEEWEEVKWVVKRVGRESGGYERRTDEETFTH